MRRPTPFTRLLLASGISRLGTQVSTLAISLVAALQLGASAAQIGLLTTCQTCGYLLIGLPAGVVADRVDLRRCLVACDLVRAAVLTTVPLAALAHRLTLAQLYGAIALTSVCAVLADVGSQRATTQLVPADRLAPANARSARVQSFCQVSGPALAGLLVGFMGAAPAVSVDVLSYLASGLLIWRTRLPARPVGRSGTFRADLLAGLRFLRGSRPLLAMTAAAAWLNLTAAVFGVALFLWLVRTIQLPATTIGAIYSAGAVGGLAASLFAGRLIDRLGPGACLRGALLGCVLAGVLTAAAGHGPRLWLAPLGLLGSGASVALFTITSQTQRQLLAPPELIGRVVALSRLAITGAVSVGTALGGLLAGQAALRPLLLTAAVAPIGSLLWLGLDRSVRAGRDHRARRLRWRAGRPQAGR